MRGNKKVNRVYLYIIGIMAILIMFIIILIVKIIIEKKYINDVIFTLNGSSIIEIEEDSAWNDPLFSAYYKNKSITSDVIVESNLNTNNPGEYVITYKIERGFFEKQLQRKIIVKEKNENLNISLIGEDIVYVVKGNDYVEPGYSVIYNGIDLSDKVVVESNFDVNVVGEYVIKYRINNGIYEREKTRKVIVFNFDYNIFVVNNDGYVKSNNIKFSTNDINYDYILLPDGTKKYDKEIIYEIVKNGEYKFRIYSKYGNYVEKTFVIKNIDLTVPSGTCIGYMYDNYTELIVNANDDNSIKGYEYIYNNKSSSLISESTYRYYDIVNDASVLIYDKADNNIKVDCSMIDKSTLTPSSYKSYTFKDPETSGNMNYWLYIPNNLTKRTSVPLLIYLHGDGSRGTNVNLVNNYAFPKFIKDGQDFPFMMIAGQISNDTNWTNLNTYKRLMNLVNNILNTYNVNPKKIMLAGGSSGGGGAYVITAAYPNYFSCTVVGSGIYNNYRKIANNLTNTPMWIFHGTNDKNISYSTIKSFADYLKSIGGNITFKGIEGAGHNVTETSEGFNNPELIKWMISQERK